MRREAGDAARGFGHTVAVFEARAWELVGEQFDDFVADGRGARAEALDAAEVVVCDDGVVEEADEEGWDDEEFFDLVGGDGLEHGGHGEFGQHDGFGVEEDGQVQRVDEAADVVEGEHGEGLLLRGGCYLMGLGYLGYDVVVGYHDLVVRISFQPAAKDKDNDQRTAFGNPVVPELQLLISNLQVLFGQSC